MYTHTHTQRERERQRDRERQRERGRERGDQKSRKQQSPSDNLRKLYSRSMIFFFRSPANSEINLRYY